MTPSEQDIQAAEGLCGGLAWYLHDRVDNEQDRLTILRECVTDSVRDGFAAAIAQARQEGFNAGIEKAADWLDSSADKALLLDPGEVAWLHRLANKIRELKEHSNG